MAPPRVPLLKRLMERHEVSPTGCWLYTGTIDRYGYGQIGEGRGKTWTTHRAAWHTMRGPIPDGMLVCHTCDVRNCINPDHLFLGTWADNTRDMVAKGRKITPSGEAHPMAKLTHEAVAEMRRLRRDGWKLNQLADRFGVNFQNVSLICLNKTWVEHDATE